MVNEYGIATLIRANPVSVHLLGGTGIGDAVECEWGQGHGLSHLAVAETLTGTNHKISQHSKDRRESSSRRGWLEAPSAARERLRARVVHVKVP